MCTRTPPTPYPRNPQTGCSLRGSSHDPGGHLPSVEFRSLLCRHPGSHPSGPPSYPVPLFDDPHHPPSRPSPLPCYPSLRSPSPSRLLRLSTTRSLDRKGPRDRTSPCLRSRVRHVTRVGMGSRYSGPPRVRIDPRTGPGHVPPKEDLELRLE